MSDAEHQRQAASFGAAAAAYDRGRPSYPAAAADWLLPGAARSVLDLGAGTGKLTRVPWVEHLSKIIQGADERGMATDATLDDQYFMPVERAEFDGFLS